MKTRSFLLALIALASAAPALAQYSGSITEVDCGHLSGFAYDSSQLGTPLTVDIYDNGVFLQSVLANQYRSGLPGSGDYSFVLNTPPQFIDGRAHQLSFEVDGTHYWISFASGVGNQLNCSGPSPGATGYTYYYTDKFSSINPSNWTQNGALSAGSAGLTATGTSGSLISSQPVQGPSPTQYEVRSILSLNSSDSQGSYVTYLRATSNALLSASQGTAYAFSLTGVTVATGACTATLTAYAMQNGALTSMASAPVTCSSQTELRVVAGANSGSSPQIIAYVNGTRVLNFTPTGALLIASGQPGVGLSNTVAGNGISETDLGPLDNVAPNAIDPNGVRSAAFPGQANLTWAGAIDDSNGTGVLEYLIARDGVAVAFTRDASYRDLSVSAGTTHTYSIYTYDYHYNVSPATTFSVSIPATGYISPSRAGVKPLGTYWGAQPMENIDVMSGNVNFSIPLLTAKTRVLSVPVSLVYNSQNWLQTNSQTWKLGADSGYGFGWSVLIGSLMPVYSNYSTIAYYIYTDSTGATYFLNQNTNGVWSSKGGVYVYYNANQGILYFANGTRWFLNCVSAGTEQDAGTMYPTLIEDVNGNMVYIGYFPGVGVTWNNSSSRIDSILDLRAPDINHGVTYQFYYNTDPIPHLTAITNTIGTAESYTFAYTEGVALQSPFSSPVTFPNTTSLQSVTTSGVDTTYSFYYTLDNSGSIHGVDLPFGSYLAWDYYNYQYPGTVVQQEIADRYVGPTSSNPSQLKYPVTHDGQFFEPTPVHTVTYIDDPAPTAKGQDQAEKAWWFQTDSTQLDAGLVTDYEQRHNPGVSSEATHDYYKWAADPAGNPYISQDTTTADLGDPNIASKAVRQQLDAYGNVIQMQVFDWWAGPNTSIPSTATRIYTNTYETGAAYQGVYALRTLLTSTVSDGSQQNPVTLVNNTVDGAPLQAATGATVLHDPNFTSSITHRGLVTTQTTPAGQQSFSYDITGTLVNTSDPAGTTTAITPDARTNSVPAVITPNSNPSLATSIAYNSFLAPSSVTTPNSATASTTYDSYGRPATSTSIYSAVTTYSYVTTPPFSTTATIDGRWTQTILDGLGRTVSVIQGDAGGAHSEVDTTYTPCGCSPLGKIASVTQPYDPQNKPNPIPTTVYTYDGLGRTLSILLPDGASQQTYAYWGNVTDQIDPAGNWRQMVTDAFGNLTIVREPNPAFAGDDTKDNWTSYTYDLMNHLTSVNQQVYQGSAYVTQSRSFNYANTTSLTAYLQSATNPETGTVSYTYNSDGTLATKIDAKSQEVKYTYDSYKRVTMIQRGTVSSGVFTEDTTQRTTYSWDANPYNSSFSQNTWGRLAAVQYSSPYSRDTLTDMFNYTAAGEVATKRFEITRQVPGLFGNKQPDTVDLDQAYTFDTEGRITQITYPVSAQTTGSQPSSSPGAAYALAYDTMGRPTGMTSGPNTVVSGVSYNPANQMLKLTAFAGTRGAQSDVRSYNAMGQLTGISDSSINLQYSYPASTNNGKISQMTNAVTKETVAYTYDSLLRLVSAQTVAPDKTWGNAYTYDGYGNLLQKTVTQGSAPTLTQTVNLNNQITTYGYQYDANGNQTQDPARNAYGYDIENRLTSAPGANYAYNPANQRVWRYTSSSATDEFAVYGLDGKRLATYQIVFHDGSPTGEYPVYATVTCVDTQVYFAGRLIAHGTGALISAVATDNIGSVRADLSVQFGQSTPSTFFPWGEEQTSTTNDRVKFATYRRDSESGLDYAWNRSYNNTIARFMSPDPYGASAQPSNPQSWNRYAYVLNDPVGNNDPSGLYCMGSSFGSDPFDPCNSDGGGCPSTLLDGNSFTSGIPVLVGTWAYCAWAPPPPPPPPPTPSCNLILTGDIAQYLGSYDGGASPLDTPGNISLLVTDGMQDDVDPRFIVALAIAETQGGTNMNWGPYNAWDIRVRNPKYKGPNKQPPYTSWDQSISGISKMIGTSTLYLGSNPRMTTAQLYQRFETTDDYELGLGNLNTALGQMRGNENALTDPCNLKNLRNPNQ